MRTRRAKTEPPGAAIGPSIVQAERKIQEVTWEENYEETYEET